MLSVQDVEKFLENRTDEEVCLVKSHADCKLRGIRAGLGHLPGEGFTGLYAIETSAGKKPAAAMCKLAHHHQTKKLRCNHTSPFHPCPRPHLAP
jgi:hypothetical protein